MPGRGRKGLPVLVLASLSGTSEGVPRLAVAEPERLVPISAGGGGKVDLGCGLEVPVAGFGISIRNAA